MTTNKLKALFTGVFLAACSFTATNAIAASNTEGICLKLGELAHQDARALAKGISEEAMMQRSDGFSHDVARVSNLITSYVYALQLLPDDARRLVYMKCKIGEYL